MTINLFLTLRLIKVTITFIMLSFINLLSLFPIHTLFYSEIILNYKMNFFSNSIYALPILLEIFINNILIMA